MILCLPVLSVNVSLFACSYCVFVHMCVCAHVCFNYDTAISHLNDTLEPWTENARCDCLPVYMT